MYFVQYIDDYNSMWVEIGETAEEAFQNLRDNVGDQDISFSEVTFYLGDVIVVSQIVSSKSI